MTRASMTLPLDDNAVQALVLAKRAEVEAASPEFDPTFRIEDDDTLNMVVAAAREAKRFCKQIDDERTAITRPMLDAKARVDKLFMPLIQRLTRFEAYAKSLIGFYNQQKVLEQRRLAEEAARDAVDREQMVQALQLAQAAAPAKVDGAVVSQVWDFEVVNPAQVPREYLVVDMAAVRAAVRGGAREIPGVRVFQKPQVALR